MKLILVCFHKCILKKKEETNKKRCLNFMLHLQMLMRAMLILVLFLGPAQC